MTNLCPPICSLAAALTAFWAFGHCAAQQPQPPAPSPAGAAQGEEEWDTTLARGETRVIDFETEEGTFMSVDVSPDGKYVVFDLLANIYRVPIEGGEAENLTADSGVAVNYHPQYSPDGEHIVFISDRKGQDNIWIMDADGGAPTQVVQDLDARFLEPAFSADGQYVFARKRGLRKRGTRPDAGVWMFHRDGGTGVEMIGRDEDDAGWPAPSADGRHLFYQVRAGARVPSGRRDALSGDMQVRRLDLATGEIFSESLGTNAQQRRASSGGAAEQAHSPNGDQMAIIPRIPASVPSSSSEAWAMS